MTRIQASCHCGAVIIQADLSGPISSARRCNCSFCKRRQAANVSAPVSSLKVLQGEDNLGLYTWGSHVAKHWFCKTCGIYTHHRRKFAADEVGINVGCIEGVDPSTLEPFEWNDGINA